MAAFDTYDFIPTGGDPEGIQTGYCICKKCKQRVETGIVNLSEHWWKCSSDDAMKAFSFAMAKTREPYETQSFYNVRPHHEKIVSFDLLQEFLNYHPEQIKPNDWDRRLDQLKWQLFRDIDAKFEQQRLLEMRNELGILMYESQNKWKAEPRYFKGVDPYIC
jgi:hypothetical protein